jgi:hypothetical protein
MTIVTELPNGFQIAALEDFFQGNAIILTERIYYRKRGDAFSKHTIGTHTNVRLLYSDIQHGWIYAEKEQVCPC